MAGASTAFVAALTASTSESTLGPLQLGRRDPAPAVPAPGSRAGAVPHT